MRVTANQRKIDLLVRVSGPDGTTIATIDLPDRDLPITVGANTTGNYRLDVFSSPDIFKVPPLRLLQTESADNDWWQNRLQCGAVEIEIN